MKLVKKLSLIGLCLILVFAICSIVMAQPQGQPSTQTSARPPVDPAVALQRNVDRATTDLKLNADDAQKIVPKIEKILKLRASSGQEIQPLRDELTTLVNDPKSSDQAIKAQLDKVVAKAAENKKAADAAEKELKSGLSARQEAQLTLGGTLTQGMGAGSAFGRAPRGGGGGGRGGAGGGGNPPASNPPQN